MELAHLAGGGTGPRSPEFHDRGILFITAMERSTWSWWWRTWNSQNAKIITAADRRAGSRAAPERVPGRRRWPRSP